VRDGEALRKVGQSADLFDDHSPLQRGVTGVAQGEGFALVGRLQYRYGQGTWNEWHALFDNGRSGWLSEDNGAYVLGFDQPVNEVLPSGDKLIVGHALTVGQRRWHVASVTVAKLIAAEGELPAPPNLERGFVVADLRAAGGEVGTLDYSRKDKPLWSVGRSVQLADLRLAGLHEGGGAAGGGGGGAERTLNARGVECPSCGAALEIKLSTTQSIVCHQCRAVVDVSLGVGGDLAHYAQQNGSEPLIPLGTSGTLQLGAKRAESWQVVGYAERCEVPEEAEDEEQLFWREYLLYNRTAGFVFLIDAEDGWSWSAPITGVPEQHGDRIKYQGHVYRRIYRYKGAVTYVLGEFYWQLQRNQVTDNVDYVSGTRGLNREETREGDTHEVVWSAGETLSANAVCKAFGLEPENAAAMDRDVSPMSDSGSLLGKVLLWGIILLVVFVVIQCDSLADSGSSGRTGGGSWGGFSSGGGHK